MSAVEAWLSESIIQYAITTSPNIFITLAKIPVMKSSLVSVFQLLLTPSIVTAYRWFNWQFDLTCEATKYIVPQDEADLSKFLKDNHAAQPMIKVVGNGHAFGNMTTCVDKAATNRSSYIVSLTNLKSMQFQENNTVTFGAGWDLVDLVPELRKHNLSVANLGTERVQNYVGAFTTGTHGTGKDLGNLATQVIGFRVLDSSGNVTIVNQTVNADLLHAFRISLGALGIITEVTVQAESVKYLKRTTQVFKTSPDDLRSMYQNISNLYKEHDHLAIWGPHFKWDNSTSNWTMQAQTSAMWWEPTNLTIQRNCTDYCANNCGACTEDSICYDEELYAVSTPPAGVCNRFFYAEIEHFTPVEHFVDLATDYTKFQLSEAPEAKGWNNMEMVYEIRFVKGDDTWMSPVNKYNLENNNSYSGVFAVFEIDWYMTYNNFDTLWHYQDFARRFIPKYGHDYNVRSHWGKMSWFNETYAETIFPHLQDFVKLQQKMDPNCQFVNEFLIEHLGLTRCSHIFNGTAPSIKNIKLKD